MKRIGITVGADNGEKHPYFAKNKKKYSILDDLIDTSTSKLPNSNYKDLRVLRDFINKLKGEK